MITIVLAYIHYSIDDMSNMSIMYALQNFMYVCFFTCMILTKQIAEIQRFISEQGVFPFVIVWVWQQRAWKKHPCNSDA